MSYATILKIINNTASDVPIADIGIIIPASGDETIDQPRLLSRCGVSTSLRDLIIAGTLKLNDGVNDVSDALAPRFLNWATAGFRDPDSSQHYIWVSPGGDDTYGDGTYYAPYKTIAYALTKATPVGVTSRWLVNLGPGIYTESPFTIPNYVDLRATSAYTTRITASDPNSDFITLLGNCGFGGFAITGVTNAAALLMATPNLAAVGEGFTIYNCLNGIKCTAGIISINNLTTVPVGTMDELLCAEGGSIIVMGLIVGGGSTIAKVAHADGVGSRIEMSNINIEPGCTLTCFACSENDGIIDIYSGRVDSGTNLLYGKSGIVRGIGLTLGGGTNAIRVDTGTVFLSASSVSATIPVHFRADSLTGKVRLSSVQMDTRKLIFPAGYQNGLALVQNEEVGVVGSTILGDLSVGAPFLGTRSIFGEGRDYTIGMNVYTTDGTASPSSDGGNLTNISTIAADPEGATFTFQGSTAGHSILIASAVPTADDVVKHWGITSWQTTAAVEVTPKSFLFEIWDGSAWTLINTMSKEQSRTRRYGNSLFIRNSLRESIRYGVMSNTTWAKKSIDGKNLYWSRIRIKNDLTTAPVFQQFKLSSSRAELKSYGTHTFHGLCRFRRELLGTGSTSSVSGGGADSFVPVGNGGAPTGWDHLMKDSRLHLPGDAVYYQFSLSRGIDTSLPLQAVVKYKPVESGASTDATFTVSALSMMIQGVKIADPAGGPDPVSRSLVNTEAVTSKPAYSEAVVTPVVDNTKIQRIESGNFYVSDYYEGDTLIVRVEMTDPGDAGKKIDLMSVDVEAFFWAHGGEQL